MHLYILAGQCRCIFKSFKAHPILYYQPVRLCNKIPNLRKLGKAAMSVMEPNVINMFSPWKGARHQIWLRCRPIFMYIKAIRKSHITRFYEVRRDLTTCNDSASVSDVRDIKRSYGWVLFPSGRIPHSVSYWKAIIEDFEHPKSAITLWLAFQLAETLCGY